MKDWFAHNVLGLPELASANGQAVDDLMVYLHWLMLALFVGWIIYFGYVLWRFKRRAPSQGRLHRLHEPPAQIF